MPLAPDILENAYQEALTAPAWLTDQQTAWLQIIVEKAERQKGVLTVLITSLTKKIETPTQDIRQHKVELPQGYSGRSYDTAYVTPFLRQKFPRFAMSESGWLTRSLEQVHAFTLDFPGKIANQAMKAAFLHILQDVEAQPSVAQAYLTTLFHHLLQQQQSEIIQPGDFLASQPTIQQIMALLSAQFYVDYGVAGASRLPVLALYAIYQLLMTTNPRYQGKLLAPLKRHTTSDAKSKSIGDIEILREDGTFFEAIEVKHGIAIDLAWVEKAFEKIRVYPVERYYLLTTAEPNTIQGDIIAEFSQQIRHSHGCEIIVNGVMPTLKYYLRLLEQPSDFLQLYEAALLADNDLKQIHRERWVDLCHTFLIKPR